MSVEAGEKIDLSDEAARIVRNIQELLPNLTAKDIVDALLLSCVTRVHSTNMFRANTIDYLDHLIWYFNRINSSWEGPDGTADDGTVICNKIVDLLNALKRCPQALGIRDLPHVPFRIINDGNPNESI
ncbi:MAG TPA: hypothetical protein VN081_04830 [Dongiaceae bacterium]|nr:hypothetical protein [Dongiaceae bacterium]